MAASENVIINLIIHPLKLDLTTSTLFQNNVMCTDKQETHLSLIAALHLNKNLTTNPSMKSKKRL